jgi:hypothetical protein
MEKAYLEITRSLQHWTDPLDAVTTHADEAREDAQLAAAATEAGWELQRDPLDPAKVWAVTEAESLEEAREAALALGHESLRRNLRFDPDGPKEATLVIYETDALGRDRVQ